MFGFIKNMLIVFQNKIQRAFLIKKFCLILALFFVLILPSGCAKNNDNPSSGKANNLTITAIDIGQGDSLLIRTPTSTTMIDTGPPSDRDKLIKYLQDNQISTIDNLIITHPHADHLGNASYLMEHFTVKNIYDNGKPTTTKLYRDYLKTIKAKGIKYQQLYQGDTLDLGKDIKFVVLLPTKELITNKDYNLNNGSIVGKLVYKNFSMLFTGDLEKESEHLLVERYGNELHSTILKAGHHGSKTSSSHEFMEKVRPEVAIISCGLHNDYGHPHDKVLRRYEAFHVKVYRTDLQGNITVTTNGDTYEISTSK